MMLTKRKRGMPSKNPSTPPPRHGRIVIEEAAQLFQQLRFSHRY
jgi:hypothetical protein